MAGEALAGCRFPKKATKHSSTMNDVIFVDMLLLQNNKYLVKVGMYLN